jgi:hypothetical protein
MILLLQPIVLRSSPLTHIKITTTEKVGDQLIQRKILLSALKLI